MATILGVDRDKKYGQLIGLNVAEVMFSRPWKLVSWKCDTRIDLFVQVLTTVAIAIATLGIALIGMFVKWCIAVIQLNINIFWIKCHYESMYNFANQLLDDIPAARKAEAIDKLSKIDTQIIELDRPERGNRDISIRRKISEATVPIIIEEMLKSKLAKARKYSPSFDQKSPLPINSTVIQVHIEGYFKDKALDRFDLSHPNILDLIENLHSNTSAFVRSRPDYEKFIEMHPMDVLQKELLRTLFKGYKSLSEVYLPEVKNFLKTVNFYEIHNLALTIMNKRTDSLSKNPGLEGQALKNEMFSFEKHLRRLIFQKLCDAHFMKISVLRKIWEQPEAVGLVGQETVDYYKELYAYPGAERMLKEEQEESDQKLYMPRGITLNQIEHIVALALQEETSSV